MTQDLERSSTTSGLPVAPSLGPTLERMHVPRESAPADRRLVRISILAVFLALVAGLVAEGLQMLIGLVTNLAFYGRISPEFVSPAHNDLGFAVIVVPVIGALIVGAMARWGSRAIRGHGIPEAMEQVLTNESRIPPRMTWLKPLSAAIAIGTGGPFGAEGPIIATGGALGSLLGQVQKMTAEERKVLLAAGAAAGMAATFGTPVAAVLLAVELLVFELRPRSLIPIALAAAAATAVRYALGSTGPAFHMPEIAQPGGAALAIYVGIGLLVGLASVGVTKLVYAVEDAFEKLPIHWMWWPAIGAVVVGVVGLIEPKTLGVGYDNIEAILAGSLAWKALIVLVGLKFVSWVVYLGSGTSGGTLAPLFTFGGGLGALIGAAVAMLLPAAGVDPRVAALVGMAAMFSGASRAFLTSTVFAFETTRQPMGLLPLLAGCAAAYLISLLLMRHTIMTEKIARRGVRVPSEYGADVLEQVGVGTVAARPAVTLAGDLTIAAIRAQLGAGGPGARHQAYPIVDGAGRLVGVLTQREIFDEACDASLPLRSLIHRPPAVAFEDQTLRQAADLMVEQGVGRLPVVSRSEPLVVVGMLTRSDLLAAHRRRIRATRAEEKSIDLAGLGRRPAG